MVFTFDFVKNKPQARPDPMHKSHSLSSVFLKKLCTDLCTGYEQVMHSHFSFHSFHFPAICKKKDCAVLAQSSRASTLRGLRFLIYKVEYLGLARRLRARDVLERELRPVRVLVDMERMFDEI